MPEPGATNGSGSLASGLSRTPACSGPEVGRPVRPRAAATIAGRLAQDDVLRQVFVERAQSVGNPRADRGMGTLADVPAGVELELGAVVVVRGPERADDRDVVGTRADMPPPVADLEPALAVFLEAGVQTHQDLAAAVRRVARNDVFQPLRVEDVLVRRRVDRLAGESIELGLGVEALDVADAAAEEDPDDRLGLGHERRGPLARTGGTARSLLARQHRTQGQPGKAHARVRQERAARHARAAPRFGRYRWRDIGSDLLAVQVSGS